MTPRSPRTPSPELSSMLLALTAGVAACRSKAPPPSAADKQDVPSAAAGLSSTAPGSGARPGRDRWSGPTKRFSGSLRDSSGTFTIDLPATFEQLDAPESRMFELNDETGVNIARLTITSMGAEYQHPKTYAEYKESFLRSATILREETGELTWAVLDLDPHAPELATAVFAQPAAADSQSTCQFDLPRSAVQGDQIPGWDAMKRACRTIQFSW